MDIGYEYPTGETVSLRFLDYDGTVAGTNGQKVALDYDHTFEIVSQDWDGGPAYGLRLITNDENAPAVTVDYVAEVDLLAV